MASAIIFLSVFIAVSRPSFGIPVDKALPNGAAPSGRQSTGTVMRWGSDSGMVYNRAYDYDNKRQEFTEGKRPGPPGPPGSFGPPKELQNWASSFNNPQWRSKDGSAAGGGYAFGNGYGPRQFSWAYSFGPNKEPGRVNFVHFDSERGMTRGQAPADVYFRNFPGTLTKDMEQNTMRNIHNIRMNVQRGLQNMPGFHNMHPENMFPDMSQHFRRFMMDI